MLIRLLAPFVSLFLARIWKPVGVLVAGAILAFGRRTVSAALWVMGLARSGSSSATIIQPRDTFRLTAFGERYLVLGNLSAVLAAAAGTSVLQTVERLHCPVRSRAAIRR
jgi:hypothetical protein